MHNLCQVQQKANITFTTTSILRTTRHSAQSQKQMNSFDRTASRVPPQIPSAEKVGRILFLSCMSNVHIDIIIEGQGTDHKIAMKEICKDNTKSLLSNKRITTFLPAPAIQCGKQTIQKEGTINAHSTTNLRRNHNSRTIYEKKPETIC